MAQRIEAVAEGSGSEPLPRNPFVDELKDLAMHLVEDRRTQGGSKIIALVEIDDKNALRFKKKDIDSHCLAAAFRWRRVGAPVFAS